MSTPLPEPLTIARWTRYGQDRAYANAPDGTRLGYMDLKTGGIVTEPGVDAATLAPALAEWCRDHGIVPESAAAPPPEPAPQPESDLQPEAVSEEDPWHDLAGNRPGEAIRAQAEAEWEARKAKSKFWAYTGRALNVHNDERAWRVGAAGEERVGPKLDKLAARGWYVLHSVPVGKGVSDIDHVLIGPGGVFTVNTKNHPGKRVWVAARQIRVDGHPVPYLRNSRFEAERAQTLLSAALGWEVPVTAALVILTGGLQPNVTVKSRPKDVLVCDAWDVPGIFKRRKGVLEPEQVEHVFAVARRSSTWV